METLGLTPGFWRGRKVLVTGHTGFKGSWLSLWLQKLGAELAGYALPPPTTPSLFEAAGVAEGMSSIEGDVRDLERLAATVGRERPEIVFHLAAQALVRPSYRLPVETYATNVMGTVNLLEAARQTDSVRVVVVVTSDKSYANREWIWGYREDEALGGRDPYSSSKACAELVTAAYREAFFGRNADPSRRVAVATARAGNAIGGGDWAQDRLVPDVVTAFSQQRPVRVRNPESIRPWQHVLDPVHGYLLLAEKLADSSGDGAEAWNFGPWEEDVRSVARVVDALAQLWGGGARWEREGAPQPPEAASLRLDSSKARARLGWAPRLRLDAALEWVVEWHRAFAPSRDMRSITEKQIGRFAQQDTA